MNPLKVVSDFQRAHSGIAKYFFIAFVLVFYCFNILTNHMANEKNFRDGPHTKMRVELVSARGFKVNEINQWDK